VAIVGVGNCASSLEQGVHYYRDASTAEQVPGLMHVRFGSYHVGDIAFVTAFDVDTKKWGWNSRTPSTRVKTTHAIVAKSGQP
jgi:myo-inositol-1-phosphate synthase